jgi:hypothetical protein
MAGLRPEADACRVRERTEPHQFYRAPRDQRSPDPSVYLCLCSSAPHLIVAYSIGRSIMSDSQPPLWISGQLCRRACVLFTVGHVGESSSLNGPLTVDLSGLPYQMGANILLQPGGPCGQDSVASIAGTIPNIPTPAPGPADIVYIETDKQPGFVKVGETFVVYFRFANLGGTATGAFTAHMELDKGVRVGDVEIVNLAPGEDGWVSWRFDGDLLARDHWIYASLDWNNDVVELSKGNNLGYNGFKVWV